MFDPIALQAHHGSIKEHGCCRVAGCAVCTETIKEQGPKNYEAMRARVDARARCGARYAHRAPGVEVLCTCTRSPEHPANYHEDESARVVWSIDKDVAHETAALTDAENTGDRGAPIGTLRCVRLQKLDAATVNLDARSLDVLLWIATKLPASKLRATCEEIAARGWVRPDAQHVEVPMGAEDHALASLLSVVRTIEGLLFRDAEGRPVVTPRRSREEVLGDAVRRGGGK